MPKPRLILASSSPERRRLLTEANYTFDVVAPREEVECGICSTDGPATLVTELAVSKALDVAARLRSPTDPATGPSACVVLACDTVAECGGEILGKPVDEDHARNMLERLRGSVHRVYSGVCTWQSDVVEVAPDVRLATSELRMDPIDDDALDTYLASGLWRGKAGAFGYQDRPGWLHLLSGTESNVIGLPMDIVVEMLAQRGISPGAER